MADFPLSVCLITKNSEKIIQRCLDSVKILAREIIIIDTGSTDNTFRIARQAGAKLYSFNWKDNFSEARNYALQLVNETWSLFIDTDEELVVRQAQLLKDFLANSDFDSFYIYRNEIINREEKAQTLRCRFLKTSRQYKYTGVIHEIPQIDRRTTRVLDKEIIYLNHYGYNVEYALPEQKSVRNIRILKKVVDPANISSWEQIYNAIALAKELNTLAKLPEQLNLLDAISRALKKFSSEVISQQLFCLSFYHLLFEIYTKLKEDKLREIACLEALKLFPNDLNLLAMQGQVYFEQEKYHKSLYSYFEIIRLVQSKNYLEGVYIHQSLFDYGTFYNIAIGYYRLNELETARHYLQKSLAVNGNFQPALKLRDKLTT